MEISAKEEGLIPCPFCGGDFKVDACDRLIRYICDPCGYHRYFPGLLQKEKSDVPVLYSDGNGGTRLHEDPEKQEYYHQFAHKEAAEKMNRRVL